MNQRQSKSRVRQAGYRMSPKSVPRSEYDILQGRGSPVSEPEGVYRNPTMTHTLTTLLGYVVDVQLQSGLAYEGVLRTVSPQMDVALEVAHMKKTAAPPSRENVFKTVELKFTDIVSISAKEFSNPSLSEKDIFKTDAEISRTNGPSASRELQPFTDFDDVSAVDLGDGDQHGERWSVDEMFLVNVEKFKVKSSYDEELTQYTTPLSRDTEDYKQRESRARKLAAEIEKNQNQNRYGVDGTGTEEELFSAVVRPPVTTAVSRPGETVSGATGTPPLSAVIASGQGFEPPLTSEQGGVDSTTTAISSEESTPSQTAVADSSTTEAVPGSASSSSDKETELPVRTTEEEEPSAGKVVGDQQAAVESEKDATAAVSGDGEEKMEEGAEQVTSEDLGVPAVENGGKKEKTIKAFRLDPNAKEFNPVAFMPATSPATAPATTVVRTAASPSPTQTSSVRTSSSAIYQRPWYSSHKNPRQRTHPHTLAQEPLLLTTPTSSGYIVSAGLPTVSAGHIQHLQQVPGQAIHGLPHYASVPSGGGYVGQNIMVPQVVAGSPKLMEMPHPHMIGPISTSIAQPQIISQPGGQPLLPVVSQPQLIQTPQGIFTAPQQHMLYMHGGTGGIHMQPGTMIQPPFIPGQMGGTVLPHSRIVFPHPSGK